MRNNILWHPHWQRRQSCSWPAAHRISRSKPPTARPLSPAANRRWMMTPALSHKMPETGRVEQINRDQVKSMDELDN